MPKSKLKTFRVFCTIEAVIEVKALDETQAREIVSETITIDSFSPRVLNHGADLRIKTVEEGIEGEKENEDVEG